MGRLCMCTGIGSMTKVHIKFSKIKAVMNMEQYAKHAARNLFSF